VSHRNWNLSLFQCCKIEQLRQGVFWITCPKGIHGPVSIDTLDQYPQSSLDWPLIGPWSVNPRSILEQHSINTLFDNWSTFNQHLGRQSVKSRLIFDQRIWVVRHLADYWPTVDRVLIECQSRCQLSVHQVCWLSIDPPSTDRDVDTQWYHVCCWWHISFWTTGPGVLTITKVTVPYLTNQ